MSAVGNQLTMISTFIKDFDKLKKIDNNNEIDFVAYFSVLKGRQGIVGKDN